MCLEAGRTCCSGEALVPTPSLAVVADPTLSLVVAGPNPSLAAVADPTLSWVAAAVPTLSWVAVADPILSWVVAGPNCCFQLLGS